MIKQFLKAAITASVLSLLASAVWAQPALYVDGTHYETLPAPVRTNDAEKIEVLEVFWYGCGHCFRFQPLVDHWAENAPEDVDYLRFPAIWNDLMKIHAQAYYTAENLGVVDTVHGPIFDAINLQRNRLQNERQLAELFAAHGVDEEAFSRAFNSFQVRTKVNQAESKMSDYQIRSTPNVIVNGKYLVTTNEAVRTQQDMLAIVDYLVEQERSAQ
ncbi:MAG TPA: disulfide bond formation protein DsbA [Pseudohongiella sp.]|jgi:protein dithiol oxidoreductase (disulfide-forming)|nr:disulfide bond formation protein DsbA [Pseudohongiella sp.]MAY55091.1 disulfide bond formation protein DsbA [Gammaproteobacteria bacterium]MBJ55425.1 disulfide bond formation protein DsbA [Gammaproteobacteria bacterium]MEC8859677.1 thiol:disulfide interchange protein DsbA/DsbL [Pseudomonadota bacterium]HBX36110.1 disulfide bond formation protein DsbA [Pseudohongiella sp.]|tara:strand:- start:565 stop:1209 length:645 start_codon:yes stop_codon:yes gene_type:complete